MVRLRHLGRKKKFFGRHMSKSQKWKRFSFHLPYVFLLPKWSTTSKKWFILFSLHLPCFLLLYPFPITVHQSFAVSPFFVCFLFAFNDTDGGSELSWGKQTSRLSTEHTLLLPFIFFLPWLLLFLWLSQFLCGCILTGLVLLYPFSLAWATVTSYRAQSPLLAPRPHQPLLGTPQ